jgi:hypothetical protein
MFRYREYVHEGLQLGQANDQAQGHVTDERDAKRLQMLEGYLEASKGLPRVL